MANSDPWDGTTWDITAPDIDQAIGNHYKELFDLRKGIAIRMNKEHVDLAGSSVGGEHVEGSAIAFFEATGSPPGLQPDGTALAASDNGRLWHDSTTNILYALIDHADPTIDGGWYAVNGDYRTVSVDGTATKVFTKYFTGTTDNDSQTNIAHGISGIDNILHVSGAIFNLNTSLYGVSDYKVANAESVNNAFQINWDGTNILLASVFSNYRSQKYRVKVEYIVP